MVRLDNPDHDPGFEMVRMFDNGGLKKADGSISFRNMSSNTTPCAPEDAPESYTAE